MNTSEMRHRARYLLRRALKSSPGVYMAVSRLRHRQHSAPDASLMMEPSVLNRGTEILIEGPRRSGNTFAVVAFRTAQPGVVDVAHHLHAAAHVVTAIRHTVPSLVLLRKPEDTVVSSVASFPPTTVGEALADYVSFYDRLQSYRDEFMVATFEQITTDFGQVISAVNDRYGTAFVPFDHTEDNVARCFELIEQRYSAGSKASHTVARPSQDRHEHKAQLRERFFTDTDATQRERAEDLYDLFNPG